MASETQDIDCKELLRRKLAGILRWHEGAEHLDERDLGDGRTLYLDPMMLGNVRLNIGKTGDRINYDDGYCYHDPDAAWRALLGWNGEGDPEGWYRHTTTGRRRPEGDPEREYIEP